MAFVLWIADGLEELGIAPGAADIFRRAAPARLDQARIKNAGFGIDEALDLDHVLPAVAKIVEVPQRLGTDILEHVAEAGLARVERAVGPIPVRDAPSDITGTDLIEVGIGPTHRRLNHQMQAIEAYIERHLDAAQDRRLDVVEGDLETGDGIGTHAATLRRSYPRPSAMATAPRGR